MRVLALTSYPITAAATRFRLLQMVLPLQAEGIELDVRPFLDEHAFASLYRRSALIATGYSVMRGFARRLRDVVAARRSDVVLLQREAAIVGPPIIELLLARLVRRPLVLDLDDPTWISYDSPTFGRASRLVKWPGKTDKLIARASVITCGGSVLASHVEARGRPARIVPTVVDTNSFRPSVRAVSTSVRVGWVGSHSTYRYLQAIAPSLAKAAEVATFSMLVVGAPGDAILEIPGVDVEMRPWSLSREVEDFRSLDVGLYPLGNDEWAQGKSGFKAIQYLAVGIPFIASPVGAAAEVGVEGHTHFHATTHEDWAAALVRLCGDVELRRRMGDEGRRHALANFTVEQTAAKLAAALREAAG
jgi:glycosyltransferase involved in cell wall biosynthesis